MKLLIKMLSASDQFEIEARDEFITILELKKRIGEIKGIPANSQRLLYKGKALSDNKTTKDYGVGEGSRLHLSIKSQGSSRSCTSTTQENKDVRFHNLENKSFITKLEDVLGSHFSGEDSKKVIYHFKTMYEDMLYSMSLDDIERLAKSNLKNQVALIQNYK
ncbi:ubiquitin-like protein 4A-B [Rhopilema esculentum]|uniref:ubiquitin-like protein 4A-B n=1 Tax=Rhopilema esculentum TaxID=499914 RepID=UPI0031D8B7FD|eukprot:gene12579-3278_t